MEIINSFKFSNGYIFEIHYLNVASTAPKSEKYQWFMQFNNKIQKLRFVKMNSQERWFENSIYLHMKNLELCYHNSCYRLTVCTNSDNKYIMTLF